MNYAAQLAMTLPEVVLSLGALALMLVAAWSGPNATRAISWAAVAVLAGACVALVRLPRVAARSTACIVPTPSPASPSR